MLFLTLNEYQPASYYINGNDPDNIDETRCIHSGTKLKKLHAVDLFII